MKSIAIVDEKDVIYKLAFSRSTPKLFDQNFILTTAVDGIDELKEVLLQAADMLDLTSDVSELYVFFNQSVFKVTAKMSIGLEHEYFTETATPEETHHED